MAGHHLIIPTYRIQGMHFIKNNGSFCLRLLLEVSTLLKHDHFKTWALSCSLLCVLIVLKPCALRLVLCLDQTFHLTCLADCTVDCNRKRLWPKRDCKPPRVAVQQFRIIISSLKPPAFYSVIVEYFTNIHTVYTQKCNAIILKWLSCFPYISLQYY